MVRPASGLAERQVADIGCKTGEAAPPRSGTITLGTAHPMVAAQSTVICVQGVPSLLEALPISSQSPAMSIDA